MWRSLRIATHYLTAIGNALFAGAADGGYGKGLISQYDLNVRTRAHELSLADTASTMGELFLMEMGGLAAATPSKALMDDEHVRRKQAYGKRKRERQNDRAESANTRYRNDSGCDAGDTWQKPVPQASSRDDKDGGKANKENMSRAMGLVIYAIITRGKAAQ